MKNIFEKENQTYLLILLGLFSFCVGIFLYTVVRG